MPLLREWARIVVRLLVAATVLGGGYLALAWWTGRQIAPSVSVEGVAIGGLTPEQAQERLQRDLGPRAAAAVQVQVAATGSSFAIDPAAAGLRLDLPATVSGLSGFTLDPAIVWSRLTGRVERPVVASIDRQRLAAAIAAAATGVERAPVDAALAFTGGQAVPTAAQPGLKVSVDDLTATIASGWPRVTTVSAPTTRIEPAIPQAALDTVLRDLVTPALSGPVTVVVGERSATLTTAEIAGLLTVTPEGGRLQATLDAPKTLALLTQVTAPFVTLPREAAFDIGPGGVPVLRPSVDGTSIDTSKAADLLRVALTSTDRRVVLPTTVAPPKLTTEAATALGVKEIVASFDSAFPDDGGRTANITLASNTINGTLIRPGETFSMNGILGQRTPEKGYASANVIVNNRLTKSTGGGISQVSTVILNLAWFSGMQLTEFHPHSFYISRYPAGREATIDWPSLDNRWTNTTPYGALVQLWVADSQVHGRIWSTKVYDVEAVAGPRTNPRPGTTVRSSSPGCVSQNLIPGFDITVQRVLRQGGAIVKQESYTTRYLAADQVICSG